MGKSTDTCYIRPSLQTNPGRKQPLTDLPQSPSPIGESTVLTSFDLWRNRLGFAFAPIVIVALWLLPFPSLSTEAHRLAAIAAGVIILWFCESLPLAVTALLGPALCVVAGVTDAKSALAPFAHPVIFLFMGSFMIARSITIHGLGERLARYILSLPLVQGSPARVIVALGLLSACLSMWISNTATTAMLFPLAMAILAGWSVDQERRGRNALTYGLLMISYSSTLGGLATPIGTPPNMVGIALIKESCGIDISFAKWMLMIGPLSVISWLALAYMLRPPRAVIDGISESDAAPPGRLGGKMSRAEINTVVVFGAAVMLWMLPGVVALAAGGTGSLAEWATWMRSHLPEAIVALLAGCALFALPTDDPKHPRTLNWEDASRIDWGTILLFGGGLSMGGMAFETGLAEALGEGIVSLTGVTSVMGLTGLCVFMASLLSETTSNTASANMAIPVAISVATAAGVNPLLPALGACLGASCGFMLPISTPPNAVVYGSGKIPLMAMVRIGIFLDIIVGLLMWFYLVLISPLILG